MGSSFLRQRLCRAALTTAVEASKTTGAPERPPVSWSLGMPSTTFARQRGVGGDHGIDAVAAQGVGDVGDLGVVEIGAIFQRHRHVFAVLVGELPGRGP